MEPVQEDITIKEGDLFEFFIQLQEPVLNTTTGEYEPGPNMNLTGWTGRGQIRADYDAATAVDFTVSFSDQTVEATRGGVLYRLSGATTANIREFFTPSASGGKIYGTGVYELELIDADLEPHTYVEGKATLAKQVAKAPVV